MSKPAFLAAIEPMVDRDQWFDAFMVSCGLKLQPDTETVKWVSQNLANLGRFGHLERREVEAQGNARNRYEYRITRQPQESTSAPASWIPFGII
jgi:hypothetical protein